MRKKNNKLWNLARTARVFGEVEEEVVTAAGNFDAVVLDQMSGDGTMDDSFDSVSHFAAALARIAGERPEAFHPLSGSRGPALAGGLPPLRSSPMWYER